MKETRLLMGMPITLEVRDPAVNPQDLEAIFAYFVAIDNTFSPYKEEIELSRLNRGELLPTQCSAAMRTILALSAQTKQETSGYFDIEEASGLLDPSGIVKGWAIHNASQQLAAKGFSDFFVDAGGDIQVSGHKDGRPWRVGIRNPFNRQEHVKILELTDCGIATSGTAIRGSHIYNPRQRSLPIRDVVSLTVIGPNIYEADRFATAAFAMGRRGIYFLENLPGFEAYLIDAQAQAVFTSGFERYVASL